MVNKMKKTLIIAMGCLFISCTAWGLDAMHFFNLGLNSSMTNNKIHYFTKALEINPVLSEAFEKRGMLYYFQEKYADSVNDFQRYVELRPFEPEGYIMLGLAYLKIEDHDKAIANLTHAIGLDPNLASGYVYRAEAYRLKGRIDEAIQDSTMAIELGGSEKIIGKAYTARSKAYRELGQIELAEKDFKRALRLDPEYYRYTYASATEYLANLAGGSSDVKRIGWMGSAILIAILFVVIFKLTLPAPKKEDDK
jgi:tetratricopeptide (TPR) repeat protein